MLAAMLVLSSTITTAFRCTAFSAHPGAEVPVKEEVFTGCILWFHQPLCCMSSSTAVLRACHLAMQVIMSTPWALLLWRATQHRLQRPSCRRSTPCGSSGLTTSLLATLRCVGHPAPHLCPHLIRSDDVILPSS